MLADSEAISTNRITRLPFRPFSPFLMHSVSSDHVDFFRAGKIDERCGRSAQAARNEGGLRVRISNLIDETHCRFS